MTTDLAAVLRDDPRFHGHAPMLLGEGCSVVAYCGSVLAVGEVLPRRHRSRVASWLDAAPPSERFELVVSHDDLGMEHVLVEDGPGHDPADLLVTGVIDRGDAALCDPAYDLDLVLRDLGPDAFDAALLAYGPASFDRGFVDRCVFLARCSVLEDLAYGVEHGLPVSVDKSLLALGWLFGSSSW